MEEIILDYEQFAVRLHPRRNKCPASLISEGSNITLVSPHSALNPKS